MKAGLIGAGAAVGLVLLLLSWPGRAIDLWLTADQQGLGYLPPNRLRHLPRQTGFGGDTDPEHIDRIVQIGEGHPLTKGCTDILYRCSDPVPIA